MSQHTDLSDISDVESVYSLSEEQTTQSLFAIYLADSETGYSSSSDDEQSETFGINGIYAFDQAAFTSQPVPAAPISLRLSKFSKPFTAIAFFDTGAAASIINPKLLPSSHWQECSQQFRAANEAHFTIKKISKPILIQLFPTLTIQHRVFGSALSGKDIIIGFDILHTIPHLQWTAEGLKYKDFCLSWSSVPNLFIHHLDSDPFSHITTELVTNHSNDSHSEFLTKHPNPLWQNSQFFVHLPFKLNEDINPTKASHRGMNPTHYALAVQELQQLEQERLIEPTSSPWACEAFYVNKRAKQAREKFRLVINYQPLNHFLVDDKFSIPQRSSLF